MIINNLKINGYGKLSNKEIQLKDGINVIYGKNEAGKSTLLNFIYSMFFGASKNKNGKELSDYDQYKPWAGEEFSGKIKYTLDDGKEYEVFRDFNKKNPQIYNKNLENISDSFNIDKTKGNQFFVEQTGIDENLFLNTMTVCQDEVVLDNSKQNALIQKITNVVSSGEDSVSYKKTIDKLNKRMLEEIGTARSTERPINVIEEEIKKLELEKNDLELSKTKVENIDNQRSEIVDNLKEISKKLDILKEIKEYKQNEILEEQKIGINTNKLNEYNQKINELNKLETKQNKKNQKCPNPIISLIMAIIIIALMVIFVKNTIITAIAGVICGVIFISNYIMYNKCKKQIYMNSEEKIKHEKELELLQANAKQCNEDIEYARNMIEQKQIQEINILTNKYGKESNVDEYILLSSEEITDKINNNQNMYNQLLLRNNTLEIEKNNAYEKLENAVKQAERLEYLYDQQKELKHLADCINLAQAGLEEAYSTMKKNITPKFTKELSEIVADVTNGEYKNISFNDTEGLLVELQNGEYVKCNRLSIGTIDQMYLALRLSILNEISKETMSIILDEPFVYYDTDRLKNILEYLANKYADRQVIIFSCTKRECEIMNDLNIQYNFVEL